MVTPIWTDRQLKEQKLITQMLKNLPLTSIEYEYNICRLLHCTSYSFEAFQLVQLKINSVGKFINFGVPCGCTYRMKENHILTIKIIGTLW